MSDASTKKREKIMMSMAGLAIVYMLITFLLPSGKKEEKPTAGPAAVDMLATISQGLGTLSNKEAVRYAKVLALAATPWQNVVFSRQDNLTEATDNGNDDSPTPATLAYTGYMGMGKGQLAIINGKDYQQGDRVEGYVLKEITPGAVLLEKNGAGVRLNIQAPVE